MGGSKGLFFLPDFIVGRHIWSLSGFQDLRIGLYPDPVSYYIVAFTQLSGLCVKHPSINRKSQKLFPISGKKQHTT